MGSTRKARRAGHSAATARLEAGTKAREGESAGLGTQLIIAPDKAHYHALFIASRLIFFELNCGIPQYHRATEVTPDSRQTHVA